MHNIKIKFQQYDIVRTGLDVFIVTTIRLNGRGTLYSNDSTNQRGYEEDLTLIESASSNNPED